MLLAFVSIASALANAFTILFQCSPINKAWGGASDGTCININRAFMGYTIVNILLDVSIPIVPACGVARLQADVNKRVLAVLMLVLGST